MTVADFRLPEFDRRVTRSDRHFNIGSGLMGLCAEALVLVLVAWALRGSEFKDSFHGDGVIVVLAAGLIVGAAIDFLARKPRREG